MPVPPDGRLETVLLLRDEIAGVRPLGSMALNGKMTPVVEIHFTNGTMAQAYQVGDRF